MNHTVLPRGTKGHHPCYRDCHEQTLPPYQCKGKWLNARGQSALPLGTHGKPRSNQRDSHSLLVSSIALHVNGRNTLRMGRRDYVGCF